MRTLTWNKNKLLLKAADDGDVDDVRKLLDKGANVEAADKYFGYTPLHRACYNGHVRVANMLLARGAKIDATDKDERTPLHYAAMVGM